MKVGDLVLINDLCAQSDLVGTVGTVIETGIREDWHSWLLAGVLTHKGVVRFREDPPQLEAVE